jgi:hypothetical protein
MTITFFTRVHILSALGPFSSRPNGFHFEMASANAEMAENNESDVAQTSISLILSQLGLKTRLLFSKWYFLTVNIRFINFSKSRI